MVSNIISNRIVFEIFGSSTNIFASVSTGSSCGLQASNLKVHAIHVAPPFPSETCYLLLNVRSKITSSSSGTYKISAIYYALVVVSRIQFISNLQLQIVRPAGCRKSIHTKGNYVNKHNWQHTMLYKKEIAIGSWYTLAKSRTSNGSVSICVSVYRL